jgi:hypothetical protein
LEFWAIAPPGRTETATDVRTSKVIVAQQVVGLISIVGSLRDLSETGDVSGGIHEMARRSIQIGQWSGKRHYTVSTRQEIEVTS